MNPALIAFKDQLRDVQELIWKELRACKDPEERIHLEDLYESNWFSFRKIEILMERGDW